MRPAEAAVSAERPFVVLGAALEELASRVRRDVDLAERLSRELQRVAPAIACVESELLHVRLAAALLAEAEARTLLAPVEARVEVLVATRELGEPGAALLVHVRVREGVDERRARHRVLAAQGRGGVEIDPQVRSVQARGLPDRALVDQRRAELDAVVEELHRRAAAAVHLLVGVVVRLVLDDDVHGIEALTRARDRALEEERARGEVDVVVDPARLALARDDPVAVEAVADLDRHALAVQHEPLARQPVQAGSAVAADLVAHERLARVGAEGVHAHVVTVVLAVEARDVAAVARELRDGETGLEVAEERVELLALELHVELLLARRLEALGGRVTVQCVVLVRVEAARERGLVDRVGRLVLLALRVVGRREEPRALDAALGEDGGAALEVVAVVQARGEDALRVLADVVVGERSAGEADQHPVPRVRFQPGAQLLAVLAGEHEAHVHAARRGRGCELDPRDAALADHVRG